MITRKILTLFFWTSALVDVSARATQAAPVPMLCKLAHVVVVGQVEEVKPLGIETTLSYPTVDKILFHWLSVKIRIHGRLKGELKGDHIEVAMLAMKNADSSGMFNGPLMIDPKPGNKYVLFLAQSEKDGVYASIFAPYDEEHSIFILDRNSSDYSMEGVSTAPEAKNYRESHQEIRDMIWTLIDPKGEFLGTGVEEFRKKYVQELQVVGKNYKIPLEWKKHTNEQGWSIDIPKTDKQPTTSEQAAPSNGDKPPN